MHSLVSVVTAGMSVVIASLDHKDCNLAENLFMNNFFCHMFCLFRPIIQCQRVSICACLEVLYSDK